MNLHRGLRTRCAGAKGTAFFAACLIVAAPALAMPTFQEVRASWRPSDAYLVDRHGEILQQTRIDMKERRLDWITLDEMSPAFRRAVLSSEDRRFESHRGVDWIALGAAALAGGRRGASTLTMQLAALLGEAPSPRSGKRSLAQKMDQIKAALELEKTWSKNQILEAYLNLVIYRGELRGIGAAARGLLGKHPSGLTEPESVLLAALLPSPKAAAERVARRACALARAGRPASACASLQQMAREMFSAPPQVAPVASAAPHLAQKLLRLPGERVATTLDARVQQLALDVLDRQISGLNAQNVRDGAVIVAENASGDVLAYVGSSGAHSQARLVDGVRAPRQAGSTLKPFLYGLAIERGYLTGASLIDDSPINLETSAGLYIPQNYDRDFKGIVSVRTALASSLNVPAVRTLALSGLDAFYDRLKALGYEGLDEDAEFYGYALALGSSEVSLLEQANAYRTLANGGVSSPLRFAPEQPAGNKRRLMSRASAFIISDILADRAGRSLTFGLANPLATRYWTAVKTGTSKNMRDNWCIGYSSDYTVAVWVGNFEGDAMWEVSGVTGAAPVWLEIMNSLHAARASRPPAPPNGVVSQQVQFDPALEPDRREWFLAGTETKLVRLLPSGAFAARIRYPANGMIIAVDPDMPQAHQVVLFQSSAQGPVHWVLNGADLGAAVPLKWTPVPGNHALVLVGEDGRPLDEITFQVRGTRN